MKGWLSLSTIWSVKSAGYFVRQPICLVTAAKAPDSLSESYCQSEVRKFDHDRYLMALFAPSAFREDLFTLYAFNLEVAKTAEVVNEPMLGHIRLQWWREAIGELYAGMPRRHEVVEPLAAAVFRHGLDKPLFDAMIDAREQDLQGTAPADLNALMAYVDGTGGALAKLSEQILGGSGSRAAAAAGGAYALAGIIRAIPFQAQRRQTFLPTALVEEVAVDMGDLFELRPHTALAKAVERLCAPLRQEIELAREDTSRSFLAARFPAVLARQYLRSIRKAKFDVFDGRVQRIHANRPLALLWAAMRGRV